MILVAWAALCAWPLVAIIIFRKYAAPLAVCLTILGGYLLLPTRVGIDLPLLPGLDKNTVPVFMAFILAVIWLRKNPQNTAVLPGWLPRDPITCLLLLLAVGGVAGTVATNGDTLIYGWRILRGLSVYDGFSILIEICIPLVPLLLGRKLMATEEGQRVLLSVLVLGALAYSVPTLYEVRMSPQLNMAIYGFFPHSFLQHMRQDGFRPIVFLNHGLDLSILMALATIGAVGLMRSAAPEDKLKWVVVLVWLLATLVLSKSLGALMIAIVLLPIILFLPPRLQITAAACIASMVLLYPILRAAHLIPLQQLLDLALDINPNRAQSLWVRIENEEMLLTKALERPLFGWGIWGRSRVFDEFGNNISVTDGSWIITFGAGGWARYLGYYGLMAWAVIGLFLSKREKIDTVCVTLALILCARLVDLIPNAGMPAYYMLVVGALIGRREYQAGAQAAPVITTAKTGYRRAEQLTVSGEGSGGPGYTRRFTPKSTRGPEAKAEQQSGRVGVNLRYSRHTPRTGGRG